jgi:hypothetical protein
VAEVSCIKKDQGIAAQTKAALSFLTFVLVAALDIWFLGMANMAGSMAAATTRNVGMSKENSEEKCAIEMISASARYKFPLRGR